MNKSDEITNISNRSVYCVIDPALEKAFESARNEFHEREKEEKRIQQIISGLEQLRVSLDQHLAVIEPEALALQKTVKWYKSVIDKASVHERSLAILHMYAHSLLISPESITALEKFPRCSLSSISSAIQELDAAHHFAKTCANLTWFRSIMYKEALTLLTQSKNTICVSAHKFFHDAITELTSSSKPYKQIQQNILLAYRPLVLLLCKYAPERWIALETAYQSALIQTFAVRFASYVKALRGRMQYNRGITALGFASEFSTAITNKFMSAITGKFSEFTINTSSMLKFKV